MSDILVCGINGFVGKHLANELFNQGHTVLGTGMDDSVDESVSNEVTRYFGNCDLTKTTSVEALPLQDIDAVINLAGLAQVGGSFGNEEAYNSINVGVHTVLADRLLQVNPKTRVVAVSTGAVYDSNQQMPLTEESELITRGSPYALSKIAMESALIKRINKGLDVITARPFNHIGPGQLPGFLVPDLATQVIAGGEVVVGNLKTERDYTDARDVVRAYVLLATKPKLEHRVFNICFGASISGEKILELITEALGKDHVTIRINQARIRPNDPQRIIGSASRMAEETGWFPTIPLEQTIRDYIAALKAT